VESVDVVIAGSSIAGVMTAAYLKQQLPDLEVLVLGPAQEDERRPYVGESLVEPATLFMREIGLGGFLTATQATKEGLSFYHRFKPDDPGDRRYSVHTPHKLHHTSWQLNRPHVDSAVRARAAELGARIVVGRMEACEIGTAATGHRVRARVGREEVAFSCRWIIDATGRTRRIGRMVANYTRPRDMQRSCFWFRLADFEPFLPDIEMAMRRAPGYDLWDTTHHFLGAGYWIWGIPLGTREHRRLISMGLTFRPDLFKAPMRSIEDFLVVVDREHPALGKMVRSGKVLDTNVYHEYLYWSDRVYSPEGWFLVGDAARAVDPLYSNGLSLTTVQIQQVAAIIARQREGTLASGDVEAMDTIWRRFMAREQGDISRYYEVTHDPFQSCMRRYWNVCGWFNSFLPLWWNGFFSVPEAARLLARFFPEHDPTAGSAWRLFEQVSRKRGPEVSQADFDSVPSLDWMINLRFDCGPQEIPLHVARTFCKRLRLRLALLRMEHFRHVREQLPALARETTLLLVLRVLLPRIGRQAFAALRPPLPRLAAGAYLNEPAASEIAPLADTGRAALNTTSKEISAA
jgi:flavin-dependent dehydrogenase